jgi:hypothetical protein
MYMFPCIDGGDETEIKIQQLLNLTRFRITKTTTFRTEKKKG